MILTTKGLTKSFGGLKAVDQVDIEIKKGELRSIIGPNGAGKTTLFNLISGLHLPDSGEVLLKGENITRSNPYIRCRKGMSRSFQRSSIFPMLTTFENIQVAILSRKRKWFDLFSATKKLVKEETFDVLESVGLHEQAGAISSTLSHGDQRLLGLGVALATGPELLLLDEPTAGLAPRERIKMAELIGNIGKQQDMTIIFIEHDMDIVFSISRIINVMYYGRFIAEGEPKNIRDNEEVQAIYLGGI